MGGTTFSENVLLSEDITLSKDLSIGKSPICF